MSDKNPLTISTLYETAVSPCASSTNSPLDEEVEDVRIEYVLENDLAFLNRSQEEGASTHGRYAKAKQNTVTRSQYKGPDKRDLQDFQMFHGRTSGPLLPFADRRIEGEAAPTLHCDVSAVSAPSKDATRKRVKVRRGKSPKLKKARTVWNVLSADWKEQLLHNCFVRCPWRDCNQIFVTFEKIKEHYKWCPGIKEAFLVCETCRDKFTITDDLLNHLNLTQCSKTADERLKEKTPREEVGESLDRETNETEPADDALEVETSASSSSSEDEFGEKPMIVDHNLDVGGSMPFIKTEVDGMEAVATETSSQVATTPPLSSSIRTTPKTKTLVIKLPRLKSHDQKCVSDMTDKSVIKDEPLDVYSTFGDDDHSVDFSPRRSRATKKKKNSKLLAKSFEGNLQVTKGGGASHSESSGSVALEIGVSPVMETTPDVTNVNNNTTSSTSNVIGVTVSAGVEFPVPESSPKSQTEETSITNSNLTKQPSKSTRSKLAKSLKPLPKLLQKNKEKDMRFQRPMVSAATPGRRPQRRAAQEARQSINECANHLLGLVVVNDSGGEPRADDSDTSFDFCVKSSNLGSDYTEPLADTRVKTEDNLRPLYNVPQLPDIPEYLQESWKKESQRRKNMICPHSGCSETYISLSGIKQHFYNCRYSQSVKPQYTCVVCGRMYGTEPGVRYHVKHHHQLQLCQMSSDNLPSTPRFNQPVDGTSHNVDRKPLIDDDGEALDSSFGESPRILGFERSPYVGVPSRGTVEPLPEALAWTYQYHQDNLSESDLFLDWVPKRVSWTLLSDNEYDTYMPAFPVSMEFILEDDKNGERTASRSLNLFESTCYDQGGVVFAGGPIWSAAWVPLPLQDPGTTQYFAIGGSLHNDATHFVSKVYMEPGLIQIYSCLNLDIAPPHPPAPREGFQFVVQPSYVVQPVISLSLGIAHDFGVVWDMKWCPSGTYQEPPASPNDYPDDVLPRLGLLACACSDGTVRIFSVPHPEVVHAMIRNEIDKMDFISVCKVSEVVTLSPSTDPDAAGVLGQCLCLDWLKLDGHARIAGGFARGAVAIWDLTTASPLLTMLAENGPTLFPHQCFLAHSEQVQSVTFSPNASDVITTVSSDRLVRVWNTANVSVPYNEMKRGLMTDSQWLSYWNGIIVAQDDCYNMEHNATYFLECGYWGHQPRLLTPHNGTIWSVTASDWLNAIVSVDSSGEVVGAVLPQMMSNLTNHKPFTKRRFCVYRLETEEMEEMKEYKDLSDENASQTAHHIPDLILTPKQEPQWPPIHCAMSTPVQSKPPKSKTPSSKTRGKKVKGNGRAPSCHKRAESGKASAFGIPLDGEHDKRQLAGDNQKCLKPLPKTFADYVRRYRMIFHLYDPTNILEGRDADRLKFPTTMGATRPDTLPVKSVQRATWNPNLGSHCWVLTGLLSGFVQLSFMSSLYTTMARKMVTDVKQTSI